MPEPFGQTHYFLADGGMYFRDTSYDWLVVSGNKATVQGSGTINGYGDYGFYATVIDGGLSGGRNDFFRIKIWNKVTGEVIYDSELAAPDYANPTLPLGSSSSSPGGGNVKIHD
ncbi:MAG: hypothetical protein KC413_03720 [Anaerolineales bacterium]|nr:hypothetical protein [Anaerolineales bacterium]